MDMYSSQKPNSGTSVISWLLPLMYLLAIIGVEISLLLGIKPGWGVLVYGLMLISLLVFAALDPEGSPMLIGLSGIPIIRIVGYSIPFSSATLTAYFGVTGLVLLFYIVPTLRIPGLAAFQILKFPRTWLVQISIIISGVAVGFGQFLVYPQKTLYFNGSLEFITFIAALALSAFVEEVIFRGIALTGLTKRFSPGIGIVFAALIYTSLFIPFGSIELGLVMFLTSLFYGFAVVRSAGLYGVMGAHFVSSLLYYLILPTI
jgi:membrane protease YdiL (CAAX protease family)